MTAREELIADLRAFADLLKRRPDMPVGEYATMKLQYGPSLKMTEAERIAVVVGLAAILGVEPIADQYGITARLDLGRIEYVAYTSTDEGLARHDAEQSYRGVVQPESVGAR